MNEFHFHQCPFVNSPCPRPEENPTRHLLPPEPLFERGYRKENHQSVSFSDRNNSREYVDVTLGNSPEFPIESEPLRRTKNISYFNNKIGESIKKNITASSGSAVIEVKVREIDSPASPAKQFNSTLGRNEVYYPYVITESKASQSRERDSRVSRSNVSPEGLQDSFSRNCYKCSPIKEERQSSCHYKNCQKCNSKEAKSVSQSHYVNCLKCKQKEEPSSTKVKFTNRSSTKEKQLAYDIKILTEKMGEFKARMVELENSNRTLATQLQNSREKLKARQAQMNVLKSQNNDLTIVVGDLSQQREHHLHIHDQVSQLRTINQSLFIQIEELKKKVVYHEEKNTESLRLLQKLNDNISQRQEILKKELDEQILITNRHLEEKNRMSIELSVVTEKLKQVEELYGSHQKTVQNQKIEIYQLKEMVSNNKEVVLEATIQELRRQIAKLEAEIKQSDSRYIVTLNELRSKQEQYSKLQIYSDQLRREKSDTFLRIEEEKTRIQSGYDLSLRELKIMINQKEEQIQRITYRNKQLEMKWKILNEENQNIAEEMKDFKEEKRIIIKQKEEIKNDCQHLITKNQKLYREIESSKEKELELNSIIANYQKDIIQIEETIGQSINDLSNRDIEIRKWKQLYELEGSKNEKLRYEIEQKLKIISTLEDSLKKESKVVLLYKEGLTRLQEKKEVEWTNMNTVYIEQIRRLEETVKELMNYNQNKRIQKFTVYKNVPETKSYIEELNNLDRSKVITTTIQSGEKIERVIPLTSTHTEFREYPNVTIRRETEENWRQLQTTSQTNDKVLTKKESPTITFTHSNTDN